jgi:hypothetical protein
VLGPCGRASDHQGKVDRLTTLATADRSASSPLAAPDSERIGVVTGSNATPRGRICTRTVLNLAGHEPEAAYGCARDAHLSYALCVDPMACDNAAGDASRPARRTGVQFEDRLGARILTSTVPSRIKRTRAGTASGSKGGQVQGPWRTHPKTAIRGRTLAGPRGSRRPAGARLLLSQPIWSQLVSGSGWASCASG